MLGTFVRQEWRTQLRSSRFAVLSTIYIAVSSWMLIVAILLARRERFFVGAAAFAETLLVLQPMATSLFAAIFTVDAVSREIDDGSFAVTSINSMTNSGYLVRRWIALLLFVTAISIVPEIIGWAAAQYFHAGISPLPFLLRWLIFVVPPALVFSALAVGMGTITGRTLVAAILTFLLTIVVLGFGNDALATIHRTLEGPGAFMGLHLEPYNEAMWVFRRFNLTTRFSTDAGFDLLQEIDDAIPAAALPAAFAGFALAVAPAFLRRTRRDVRPWPVRPDHPLRTYLRMINRAREEYAPEPKLHLFDVFAVSAGVLVLLLSIAYLMKRSGHYETLAAERFAAEVSEARGPMPPSLQPVALILDATLGRDGGITSAAELTIRNDGREPQRALSFELNHALQVARLHVSSGTIATTRVWDRIGAVLTPPLAPGQSIRVSFSIEGRPASEEFNLSGRGAFSNRYRHYEHSSKAVDLSDLSRSTTRRLVTPITVDLRAADLTPIPRYSPWTLVAVRDDPRDGMPAEEGIRPATDLRVTIHGAPGSVIADSCGSIESGPAGMQSRCTLPIVDYRVTGGRLEIAAASARSSVVIIPAHRAVAAIHTPDFLEAADVARSAWPGLSLPPHLVFLERPVRSSDTWLRGSRSWGPPQELESSGALQIISESTFRERRSSGPVAIAVELIGQSLAAQRRVAPEEQQFLSTFFSAVASRRLGAGNGGGAVLGGFMTDMRPLLQSQLYGATIRLRAVLSYLEYLVGPDRLVAGINAFVHRQHGADGTSRELFRDIERASGVPLDRFYTDFVAGGALPVMTLEHVEFRHSGSGWIVTGLLRNSGSGQLFCPLVLRTELEPVRRMIAIDSGQSVPFSFSTRYRPRAVQADPDRVCYRHAATGALDSVEYQGGA